MQIGIVFFICFISVGLALWVPLPATIIAMLLMFPLLLFRVIKLYHVKEKSDFLLKNMTIFFIPAGVEIINYTDYLKDNFFVLLFICVITTLITFAATAYTVMLVTKIQKKLNR